MIKNIFRAIGIAACFGLVAFIFAANHDLPAEGNELKIALLTFFVVLCCVIAIWCGIAIFIDSYL